MVAPPAPKGVRELAPGYLAPGYLSAEENTDERDLPTVWRDLG